MRLFRFIPAVSLLLAAAVLGTVVLGACSGNGSDEGNGNTTKDRDQVRSTVQDFVTALDERDEQKLYDLLASESRDQTTAEEIAAGFPSIEGLSFKLDEIPDEDILFNETNDVASVNATVTVELDDQEQQVPTTFLLQKEDDRWRFIPGPEPAQGQNGGQDAVEPAPEDQTPSPDETEPAPSPSP